MDDLTSEDVTAFRLTRHHLTKRAPLTSVEKVVGDVCGIQAQLMSAAELALWARVQDIKHEDIEAALWKKRSLAKTWCMRGALHLLVSEELPIYVGGLSKRGLQREREWIHKYGISDAEMNKMVDSVNEALADEALTRKELARRVAAKLGAKTKRWVEHSWGGIVKQASLMGHVVFGPNFEKEITFVRLDKWLPHVKNLKTEDAENRLLLKYLHGYAPACLADFAAWSGMTVADAMPIKERVNKAITEVKADGKTSLMLRNEQKELQNASAEETDSVRLLPNFDCFMLGHKNKSHLVDAAYYKRVYRKAGWLSPVVLINGKAEGVWTYKKKGQKLKITVEPFKPISKNIKRQIEEEAASIALFYNASPETTFTR